MQHELKPAWRKFFDFNWKFGIFLIAIICIPRFILVLFANSSGNYSSIGLIMFISAIAPFIFLTKYGRKKIGITKPSNYHWLFLAFAIGFVFSLLLHYLGQFLYGNTVHNWYSYIGKSYNIPAAINQQDKKIMFAIVALTSMLFSPVGEELFFRGIVHTAFAKTFGERKATIADSSAFAIVHLSHFGLVFINNKWDFLTIPALIWISCMFLVSLFFGYFKKKTGSLAGAIICHAAFNLGMTYCIFYLL